MRNYRSGYDRIDLFTNYDQCVYTSFGQQFGNRNLYKLAKVDHDFESIVLAKRRHEIRNRLVLSNDAHTLIRNSNRSLVNGALLTNMQILVS